MRSVVDFVYWVAVDDVDATFKELDTNVYMGMVADGVNPHGNQSPKYYVWPILLALYNLPPWLVSKKFFVSLTLLILGDKASTRKMFDIFLAPLVRDLLKLWGGVSAVDASRPRGERRIILRAILLWIINDFPAYRLISGQ
jgi:hypothetical protein